MYDIIRRLFNINREDDLSQQPSPEQGYVDLKNLEHDIENPIVDNIADIGGIFGYGLNTSESFQNINDIIKKYREMSIYHYVDDAINEIVNEIIVKTDDFIVDVTCENTNLSDTLKEEIYEEFKKLLYNMDWRFNASQTIRQWYIDGRLYSQNLYNKNDITDGIIGINILSPFNLTRVKSAEGKQFYIYKVDQDNRNYTNRYQWSQQYSGFIIPEEHINFTPSGIQDPSNTFYVSDLHKAIKPFNNLKMIEDSAVIYHFTRAVEKRVFKINTGRMPVNKANEYVKKLMDKFKNRIFYDSTTGALAQQKNTMIMSEDYWLPLSEDGKGTDIQTLAGGTQLPDLISMIETFKRGLLTALKVPFGRFDIAAGTSIGYGDNAKEIARDEIRFAKFINDKRDTFANHFFVPILKKHIIAKNILDVDEWSKIENDIRFVWAKDQYYEEISAQERLKGKLELISSISPYIGKDGYFSKEYVYKNIINFTEEQIEAEREKIALEEKLGTVATSTDDNANFAGDDIGNAPEENTEEPILDEPENAPDLIMPDKNKPLTFSKSKLAEPEPEKAEKPVLTFNKNKLNKEIL